jgi:hypothetical protein
VNPEKRREKRGGEEHKVAKGLPLLLLHHMSGKIKKLNMLLPIPL